MINWKSVSTLGWVASGYAQSKARSSSPILDMALTLAAAESARIWARTASPPAASQRPSANCCSISSTRAGFVGGRMVMELVNVV
jgi:hypothetical protein